MNVKFRSRSSKRVIEYTSQMLNSGQNPEECDATDDHHYCPVKLIIDLLKCLSGLDLNIVL